jgi:hypothetical protein
MTENLTTAPEPTLEEIQAQRAAMHAQWDSWRDVMAATLMERFELFDTRADLIETVEGRAQAALVDCDSHITDPVDRLHAHDAWEDTSAHAEERVEAALAEIISRTPDREPTGERARDVVSSAVSSIVTRPRGGSRHATFLADSLTEDLEWHLARLVHESWREGWARVLADERAAVPLQTRLRQAAAVDTTEEAIGTLTHDASPAVRMAVARRESLSWDATEDLAGDPCPLVRALISRHHGTWSVPDGVDERAHELDAFWLAMRALDTIEEIVHL